MADEDAATLSASTAMAVSTERTRARLADYREWASGVQKGRAACAIINADDWGESVYTTDRILDCVRVGSVTAVSAMVFMADSERAAEIARAAGIDVGLHLNLTTHFSAMGLLGRLSEHHDAVASHLRRSRFSRYVYHPGLTSSFDYVVASQLEEFSRLYGEYPPRVDGHHHMHLSGNVIMGHLLPQGVVIRRNFSFGYAEKNPVNRSARRCYDFLLSRRYRMVDAFVTLAPVQPFERLAGIFSRACRDSVEIETHPASPDEYGFLTGNQVFELVERRHA
jgi:chitin disaccharide deacetylase